MPSDVNLIPGNLHVAAVSIDRLGKQGWNYARLFELSRVIGNVLCNYERISGSRLDFTFEARRQTQIRTFKIDSSGSKIKIYLPRYSKETADRIPLMLSQLLAGSYFKLRGSDGTEPGKSISIDDSGLTEPSVGTIVNFYAYERKLFLDQGTVERNLVELAERFGMQLIEWKMVLSLLAPYSPPKSEVGNKIDKTIAGLIEKARTRLLRDGDPPVPETIAHLAYLSVIANQCGIAGASIRCGEVISEEPGQHLAQREFLFFKFRNHEKYQKFPLLMDFQLKKAIEGFNLIFFIFLRIFNYYFDKAEI